MAKAAISSGLGPQASLALPTAAAPVASHRILPPMLTRIDAGSIAELVPEKKESPDAAAAEAEATATDPVYSCDITSPVYSCVKPVIQPKLKPVLFSGHPEHHMQNPGPAGGMSGLKCDGERIPFQSAEDSTNQVPKC